MPALPPYLAVNPNDYFDLNALNRESDTTAAERAVGGGFGGSPFARNFNAGLRFSQQQAYLNPYLDRAQQSQLQANQIAAAQRLASQQQAGEMARLQAQLAGQSGLARQEQDSRLQQLQAEGAQRTALAQLQQGGEMSRLQAQLAGQAQNLQTNITADAARQAVDQAGLTSRLNTEQSSRMALAIQQGNQSMQERILSEAGVTSRQATELAARARENALNLQQRSFEAILPYLQREQDTRRGNAPWQVASQPRGLSQPAMLAPTSYGGPTPRSGATGGTTRGGATGQAISKVDSILGMYGLGNGGTGGAAQGGSGAFQGAVEQPLPGQPTIFDNTGALADYQTGNYDPNFTQEDWDAYYG